ncbi:hypothetical protein ACFQVA_27045 [Actinomadura keratinilytica]
MISLTPVSAGSEPPDGVDPSLCTYRSCCTPPDSRPTTTRRLPPPTTWR